MDIKQYLESYQTAVAKYEDLQNQLSDKNILYNVSKKRSERKSLKKDKDKLNSKIYDANDGIYFVLGEYADALVKMPGDEKRFKEITGYDVEFVDIGSSDKGVVVYSLRNSLSSYWFDSSSTYIDQLKSMMTNKVVGLIEVQFSQKGDSGVFESHEKIYYGLPVRKVD
jgi:hypothetical protein